MFSFLTIPDIQMRLPPKMVVVLGFLNFKNCDLFCEDTENMILRI